MHSDHNFDENVHNVKQNVHNLKQNVDNLEKYVPLKGEITHFYFGKIYDCRLS